MAIFHLHSKNVNKQRGMNPVAMAAYRAGVRLVEEIYDEGTGVITEKVHNYSKKPNVAYEEVMIPPRAPSWMQHRQLLWNSVLRAERHPRPVYASEMDAAIPIEFDLDTGIAMVREFAKRYFVLRGIVVDIVIHWDVNNPHTHMMMLTREVNEEGYLKKNHLWHRKAGLVYKRRMWAETANKYLQLLGFTSRIDYRSYWAQGVGLKPTRHEGAAARAIFRRTGTSEMSERNRMIREENLKRLSFKPEIILKKLKADNKEWSEENIRIELLRHTLVEDKVFRGLLVRVTEVKGQM